MSSCRWWSVACTLAWACTEGDPTLAPQASSGSDPGSDPGSDTATGTASSSSTSQGADDLDTSGIGTSDDESSTSGQDGACGPWPSGGPATIPTEPIDVGGGAAWVHDEGHAYGYFHTFDGLQACDGASPRKVHVLLPRDYEAGTRRYPVLYMNDGNTTFWPGGAANKSWRVAEGLSELDECAVEAVIVVAIHPLDREVEYTHAAGGGTGCCGVEAYVDELADCIKPFVDANYRTVSEAKATGVAGSSHGGLAAFLAGTLRPDAFGRVIAMSPSFWVGLDLGLSGGPLSDSLLVELAEPTLVDPELRPSLWIDWGLVRDGGFHNAVIEAMATDRGREMADLLQASYGYTVGEDLFVVEDRGGGHDEDAWAARFGPAMRASFPPDR